MQEVKDFRLDGDIQRGGRLVGDKQVGFVDQRHRDHDALQLSAGEFMRVLLQAAFDVVDADAFEQGFAAGVDVSGCSFRVVRADRFAKLFADAHVRVQRGHRLLEDHADAVAPEAAQGLFVGIKHGNAVEFDA